MPVFSSYLKEIAFMFTYILTKMKVTDDVVLYKPVVNQKLNMYNYGLLETLTSYLSIYLNKKNKCRLVRGVR